MFREKLLFTYYAHTPIHVGSGTSVSYVDLPVQREKHTDYPMISASGIKGVIRDLASREWNKDKVDTIFGPEDVSSEYASCIAFTDARILLFPVRSVKGVFAYITCPNVLKRFKRDLESVGIPVTFPDVNVPDDKVSVCSNSNLKIDNNRVAFEEFGFGIENTNCDSIAGEIQKFLPSPLPLEFKKHFTIVSDNTFRDFTKYAVEIRTRIRIDQTTGTVAEKALFSMELIPSESVFYNLVFISEPRFGIEKEIQNKFIEGKKQRKNFDEVYNTLEKDEKEKLNREKNRFKQAYAGDYLTWTDVKTSFNFLNNSIIQLGGDETLGMGLMEVKVYPESSQQT